ncbi:MAG: proline dehydrogenase family protein [Haloarculaceae archaeon]
MIPPLARRFVAGETSAEAIEHVRRLNERGVGGILNLLGEHYTERGPAAEDARAYEQLLADLAGSDLRACVSVKPSQLGLFVSEETFREHLARVVDAAREHDGFVWLDMENHTTTDATLDAYEHHAREGGRVGVCVQANLRRTRADLERLAGLPGKVRLVKGAYDPPADLAYASADRVNDAYREDLRYMFRAFEGGIAVGSHDPAMLDLARRLHAEYGTPYEVQMLMGVRDDAQFDLAADTAVWQYVPYGGAWIDYFGRRVLERKDNALFALRAIAGSLR